ncbi:MAG: hypothetical protein V7749_00715 [Cocleimonas sp.]
MTMIKKMILVTCMFAVLPVFAGDHEFLTTNPYGVDVPYSAELLIGVEKPRVVVEDKIKNRSGVRAPQELQTPIVPEPKSMLGQSLDKSSFYEDDVLSDDSTTTSIANDSDDEEMHYSNFKNDIDDETESSYSNSASSLVSSSENITTVEQPKSNSLQQKLMGTASEFLMIINPSPRVFVSKSDGKVYFQAKKGGLEDNLNTLLQSTNTELPIIYEVSNQHVNPTDIWIYGDTVLDVLDTLLSNYVDPHPIRAETYTNRIVEIYYDKKNRH